MSDPEGKIDEVVQTLDSMLENAGSGNEQSGEDGKDRIGSLAASSAEPAQAKYYIDENGVKRFPNKTRVPDTPKVLPDGSLAVDENGEPRMLTKKEEQWIKKFNKQQRNNRKQSPGPWVTPDDQREWREALLQRRVMQKLQPHTWTEDNRTFVPRDGRGWMRKIETIEENDENSFPYEEKRKFFKWSRAWKIKIEHANEKGGGSDLRGDGGAGREAHDGWIGEVKSKRDGGKLLKTSANFGGDWTEITHGSITGHPPRNADGRGHKYPEPAVAPDFFFMSAQNYYTGYKVDKLHTPWLHTVVAGLAEHNEHSRVFENPTPVHRFHIDLNFELKAEVDPVHSLFDFLPSLRDEGAPGGPDTDGVIIADHDEVDLLAANQISAGGETGNIGPPSRKMSIRDFFASEDLVKEVMAGVRACLKLTDRRTGESSEVLAQQRARQKAEEKKAAEKKAARAAAEEAGEAVLVDDIEEEDASDAAGIPETHSARVLSLENKNLDTLFDVDLLLGEAARNPEEEGGEPIDAVRERRAKNVFSVRFVFPNLQLEYAPETARKLAMNALQRIARSSGLQSGWAFLLNSVVSPLDKKAASGSSAPLLSTALLERAAQQWLATTPEDLLFKHATTLGTSAKAYMIKDTTGNKWQEHTWQDCARLPRCYAFTELCLIPTELRLHGRYVFVKDEDARGELTTPSTGPSENIEFLPIVPDLFLVKPHREIAAGSIRIEDWESLEPEKSRFQIAKFDENLGRWGLSTLFLCERNFRFEDNFPLLSQQQRDHFYNQDHGSSSGKGSAGKEQFSAGRSDGIDHRGRGRSPGHYNGGGKGNKRSGDYNGSSGAGYKGGKEFGKMNRRDRSHDRSDGPAMKRRRHDDHGRDRGRYDHDGGGDKRDRGRYDHDGGDHGRDRRYDHDDHGRDRGRQDHGGKQGAKDAKRGGWKGRY